MSSSDGLRGTSVKGNSLMRRFRNQQSHPPRRQRRGLSCEPLEQRRLLNADFGFALGANVGSNFGVGAEAVATDRDGSVYVAGNFSDTIDLAAGNPQGQLSSVGQVDPFVAKYSSTGSLIWARSFGGSGFDFVRDLAVDSNGNVLVVGAFQNTADFNPGTGTFNLSSGGESNAFVLKLNSSGEFQWAGAFAGNGFSEGRGVAVNNAGEVLAVGAFDGTIDFDPGVGTANRTTHGDLDGFVAKLGTDGKLIWAGPLGGTGADLASAVTVDTAGNVIVVGDYQLTGDFDPSAGTRNLTSVGGRDGFVAKLTAGGGSVWARSLGGTGLDVATGVAVDALGDIYTTGSFTGVANFFELGAGSQLIAADSDLVGSDAFVAKLHRQGSFEWARGIGTNSTRPESGRGISVSPSGDVFLAADLATANGNVELRNYDAAGALTWQATLAGNDSEAAAGIAIDGTGSVFTVGTFLGTTDFDPSGGKFELTNPGATGSAVFLSKLTQNLIGDRVWRDTNGNGVQGVDEVGAADVVVELFDTVDGTINANDVSLGTDVTDALGRFSFADIAAGSYYLEFRLPAQLNAFHFTQPLQGSSELDSNVDVVTGRTAVFVVNGVTGNTTLDAGIVSQSLHPWQNPRNRFDVNDDKFVVPLDVLLVINELERAGSRALPVPPSGNNVPPPYFDVSGDDFIAPIDVLQVINAIESGTSGSEGEAAGDADPPLVGLPPMLSATSSFAPRDPSQSGWGRPAEVGRSGTRPHDHAASDQLGAEASRRRISTTFQQRRTDAPHDGLHRKKPGTDSAALEEVLAEIAPDVAIRRSEIR